MYYAISIQISEFWKDARRTECSNRMRNEIRWPKNFTITVCKVSQPTTDKR